MWNEKLFVRRFTVGSYPINGYLLAERESGTGAFIDPGGFSEDIAEWIERKKICLRYLLFTHGHWDHTEGTGQFRRRYDVDTIAGEGEIPQATRVVCHGEQIQLGNLTIVALSTPGHTSAGISYYAVEADMVFTGDALFSGSVGGTASQKNSLTQLDSVRRHVFSLPDYTQVFPAHGPMTIVAAEKYHNPFFYLPLGETTPSDKS